MSHKSIKLAAAIVNRGAGNRAAAIFHTYNHEILLAVRGHGTASSAVMDCLGLDEPEKDWFWDFHPKPTPTDCSVPLAGKWNLVSPDTALLSPFPSQALVSLPWTF